MSSIGIAEILEGKGVDIAKVEELLEDNKDGTSQFFSYQIGDAERIDLESTAPILMKQVLRLPVFMQIHLLEGIAHYVKNPGDQIVLTSKGQRRSARVVRMASVSPHVTELLLTH